MAPPKNFNVAKTNSGKTAPNSLAPSAILASFPDKTF